MQPTAAYPIATATTAEWSNKLSPQKSGKWAYSVVHKFTAADGEYPLGVIIDGKGNLFGTTQSFGKYHFGTAFEITP